MCVRTATKPIATMKVANTNANKLVPTKTANRMKESKNKLVAADAAATKAVKQMEAGMDESLKEAVQNNAKREDLEALEAQLEAEIEMAASAAAVGRKVDEAKDEIKDGVLAAETNIIKKIDEQTS